MEKETSTISCIIPSYNQAQYLAESIKSALSQTIKFKEVIVIDDNSNDNSLDIAFSYPVKLISQVNKGLASARNTGIMNAKGDYCLFLDADDILLPNAVEKILQKIEQTNADIVAGSFREFGLGNREVVLMENPTLEDFKTGNRLGYSAAIRRSALLAIGGYSTKMVWGAEDYHLWINLLTRGFKIATISDIIWLYRIKQNSMWTETQKHEKEFKKQINKDFPECQLTF